MSACLIAPKVSRFYVVLPFISSGVENLILRCTVKARLSCSESFFSFCVLYEGRAEKKQQRSDSENNRHKAEKIMVAEEKVEGPQRPRSYPILGLSTRALYVFVTGLLRRRSTVSGWADLQSTGGRPRPINFESATTIFPICRMADSIAPA